MIRGFFYKFNRSFKNLQDVLFHVKLLSPTLSFEQVEVLLVTSQFLLKGHKMLNFLFAFLLKISETLKAYISGTETDIKKR